MSKVNRSLDYKDFHQSYKKKMKAKSLKPKSIKFYKLFLETMGQVYTERLVADGIVGLPAMHGNIYLKNKKRKLVRTFAGNGIAHATFNDDTGPLKMIFWQSNERRNKKLKSWAFSGFRHLKRSIKPQMLTGKVYPDFDKMLQLK
jgi:hypothetical protein